MTPQSFLENYTHYGSNIVAGKKLLAHICAFLRKTDLKLQCGGCVNSSYSGVTKTFLVDWRLCVECYYTTPTDYPSTTRGMFVGPPIAINIDFCVYLWFLSIIFVWIIWLYNSDKINAQKSEIYKNTKILLPKLSLIRLHVSLLEQGIQDYSFPRAFSKPKPGVILGTTWRMIHLTTLHITNHQMSSFYHHTIFFTL
jgi:hypothetical protein